MNGGAVLMVPIAYAMSSALIAAMWRSGLLQRGRRHHQLARIAVALFAYLTVNIAFPLDEPNPLIYVVVLGVVAVLFVVAVWLLADRADAPTVARVGQPMQSEVLIEWEDDDDEEINGAGAVDDWTVQPVDELYDDGRRQDRGSEVRIADEDSGGAASHRTPTVDAAASVPAHRSGRGRRLHGVVLSGQGAPHPSAGGYNAASAAIVSTIAAAESAAGGAGV